MPDGELMCQFKERDRVRWVEWVWKGSKQFSAEHRGDVLGIGESIRRGTIVHVKWDHEPASWWAPKENLELVAPSVPAIERRSAWERIMEDE